MTINVNIQAQIFLYSVIGGIIIAFIYDIFRIKRKAIKTNAIFIHIEDFLYWIIVALVMFGVVYYSNDGEIRGFIFIGTVIGVTIYVMLLSRLVVGTSMIIIKAVYKTLHFIWKVLSYPFKLIYKILSVPAIFLLRIFRKSYRRIKHIGKNRLSKAAIWSKVLKNMRKKF